MFINEKIKNLPITPYLEKICQTLKNSPSRFLVLTAQTAAGKSTAVPLALLENFNGKILMLEPRRLATVALAERISSLIGEKTGETVGYTLSLESKISQKTRFEVITEAILTRRLQNDPLLEDTNVLVIDEFHERSVHADLALAFLKEAMSLRDDLFVIIMSATINSKRIAEFLSQPAAPIMEIPGRQFPVEIIYKDKISVKNAVLEEFSQSINYRSLVQNQNRTDTILVFLPGIAEINNLRSELENSLSSTEAEILTLHSSIPLSEQKKILSKVPISSPRRIILSSSIAETSLTVPGVTTVIDSGLSRINKMNISLGMERLVTEKVSQFSADQRAGRAGRLMSGRCVRLWSKFDILNSEIQPEILRCNLASLVLECAKWGSTKIDSFFWLDSPSKSAWNAATTLLTEFGFLENEKITQNGKFALELGIEPRLACAILYGKKTNHLEEALNFALKFSQYGTANEEQKKKFLSILKKRIEKCNFSSSSSGYEEFSQTELLLSGFPDRLGKKQPLEEQSFFKNAAQTLYQFPSAHKAVLSKTYQESPEWLIAPEVNAGSSTGKIYSFEKIDSNQLENWLKNHSEITEELEFDKKNFSAKKTQKTSYGAILLKEKKLPVSPQDFGKALCAEIQKNGLSVLPFDKKTFDFLLRAQFYANHIEPELFTQIESLQKNAETWLLPFITSSKIDENIVFDALFYFLNGTKIDCSVPSSIILENGKKAKIKYESRLISSEMLNIGDYLTNVCLLNVIPILEIIIQQIFGCFSTPKISGIPVLLKLLSPARRPLQITDNLENFWSGAWIEICKEMKGRYPKHNWDYRLTTDS